MPPIPLLVPEYLVPASPQYSPDTPYTLMPPDTPKWPLQPLGVPMVTDAFYTPSSP